MKTIFLSALLALCISQIAAFSVSPLPLRIHGVRPGSIGLQAANKGDAKVDLLKQAEKLKLLTFVSRTGILSKIEKSGLLSQLEKQVRIRSVLPCFFPPSYLAPP